MSAIGKGDWVEFLGLDGFKPSWPGIFTLKRGGIYCVAEVGRRCRDRDGKIYPALRIVGQPTHTPTGRPVSCPVAAFRPIYRPNTDFIESLKRPAPALEPT